MPTRAPSRLRARAAAAAAALLLAACGGGGGGAPPAPDPAIVAVAPTVLWRGGPATLTVTGVGTSWSAEHPPTVDLEGPATAVTVLSATSLSVAVTLPHDAPTGPRPVRVLAGPVLVGPDVDVAAPVVATWFSTPFVRSSVLVGAASARRPGVTIAPTARVVSWTGEALPLLAADTGGFVVVLPETAPLGPFEVHVDGTGPDGPATFRVPAGSIAPRATVLETFPKEVTLPTPDGTALHRVTASVDGLVECPLTTPDPTPPVHFLFPHASPFAPPVVGLAPTRFGRPAAGPRTVARVGEQFDVIVFAGFATYTLGLLEHPATVVPEAEPDDDAAAAMPLLLPALVDPAAIEVATDDLYRVTVGPDEVGLALRVVSSAEAPISVSVLRQDGGTLLAAGGGSTPGDAVDLRTDPLPAAETVYVLVRRAGDPSETPATTAYRLYVAFETP